MSFDPYKPKPSPRMIEYWSKLAKDWESMGNQQEALNYYRKALNASKSIFGDSHKVTRLCQDKLAALK